MPVTISVPNLKEVASNYFRFCVEKHVTVSSCDIKKELRSDALPV